MGCRRDPVPSKSAYCAPRQSLRRASDRATQKPQGDVVNIPELDGHAAVSGVAKSRLFNYLRSGEELFCGINIVVEERDDIDWGALIKE